MDLTRASLSPASPTLGPHKPSGWTAAGGVHAAPRKSSLSSTKKREGLTSRTLPAETLVPV